MKKTILFALIGLVLIPSLASAQFGYGSWYKDVKVEKSIPEITAGNTDTIIVSFKNPTSSIGTLIARLQVDENTGEHPVSLGDFKVRAILNSTSLYPGNLSSIFETDCLEKTNGTFYCFNLTDIETVRCFEFHGRWMCLTGGDWIGPEGSFMVLPGSKNNLTLHVTFHPALIPADYTFNVSLFNDLLIPSIIDPLEHSLQAGEPMLFNASYADTLLWLTTSENKSLLVDVILYEHIVGEPFSPPGLIPIRFVGIEANDTKNITSTEIWIYYNDEEIPTWADESSLRMYYYDDTSMNPDDWGWSAIEESGLNAKENYVWAKTDHLSLFGIFGSPEERILTFYRGGGTDYVYRNRTKNITREVVKETPAEPVCGNGICEAEEAGACPGDCQPPRICVPGVKVCTGDDLMQCSGDGSEWNRIETCEYGCSDHECNEKPEAAGGPPTGLVIGTQSSLILGFLIAVALVVGGLSYIIRKK